MWHLRVGFFAPSLLKYLNLVNSIRLKVCKTLNIPKVLLKYHVFCTEVLHFNVNLQEYSRYLYNYRSSRSEVFLGKDVLKLCSKLTGEQPCRSVILVKLFCSFVEITLRHGCLPIDLLHIFRIAFPKNTYRWLLVQLQQLHAI